jgi:hypothetical protein
MKRALLGVLFVAACGGKSSTPATCPETPATPVMATSADLDVIEQKVCACGSDFDCVEGVFQEHAQMGLTFAQVGEIAASHGKCAEHEEHGDLAVPPRDPTGIADCDAYVAAVDTLATCDKIPREQREGMEQSVEAMIAGWKKNTTSMSVDTKKATADACRQATDAIKQSEAGLGCPM